jgi:serine/threonine protein kinase
VALVVGVGKYPHPEIRPLDFAAHDAEAIAESITDPDICGFPPAQVEVLLDENASRDTLVQRLSRWLPERSRGAEIVLFYFAGHGLVQTTGAREEGYLLPADADPDNPAGRGIPMSEVAGWIQGLDAGAVVVCLDCCHAGSILARGDTPLPARRDFVLRPDLLHGLAGRGRFLLASCDKGEFSVELAELRHGLFTYHLLQGLGGEGDRDNDGKVGVAELFEHVAESVARDARQRGLAQHPWNASVGAGGVYLARPRRRSAGSLLVSFERLRREEGDEAVVREVERRLPSCTEPELLELLRRLGHLAHPAAVPALFRYLLHSSASVREQARRALQAIGWEKSLAFAEDHARSADDAARESLLAGLAVFEARADLVHLLDRLVDVFRGDLRVRALQLLEHKRLGLDLEKTAAVFRQIRSPYRLQKVLGQGVFTASYLAHDEVMSVEAVVRVLRPEFVGRPEVRRHFLDLCRKAIHYHHPNLAHTLEVRAFAEENVYYIVRQYIPGVTLQHLLAAGRRFEPHQVLEVARQLLLALSALHPNGIAHGAVKPSNVFICSSNHVVLGDLGLPPQGVGEDLVKRLAYDYRYTAPEILVSGIAAPAADLYALGCIAYELLCGRPPFLGDHYNDVLVQQATCRVPPPRRHCSNIPPGLEKLILRLLEKEANRRPASLEEVLRSLEENARALRDEDQPISRLKNAAEVNPPPAGSEASEVRLLRDASLAAYRPPNTMLSMGASGPMPETIPPSQSLPSALGPNAAERRPPPAIAGYEILGEIGRGGMGTVYQARQISLNRLVALKMLLGLTVIRDQRRFKAEAEAVARLQHPNIVAIYEIGEYQRSIFVSLEYCGGGSLADKIQSQPLAATAAAVLTQTLARAVHHAHLRGVIHRDLKPANVLLTEDAQPKITDFGLAKIEDAPALTHSGEIMGTPSYMAPEQALGAHRVGPEADVYALGAILYECLSGKPPFRATTVLETLEQVRSKDPISLRHLRPDVPRDLEVICLKCLEKEPARRYASAEALAVDLQKFLDGGPIAARPASPAEKARRWVRRRPTVKAFLWLSALVGLAAMLWQAFR